MRKSVRHIKTRLVALSAATGLTLVAGCASTGDISGQPGVGDAGTELLTLDPGSANTALDARLRRQGLHAVRDGDNRIRGYQVYFHGRGHARPNQIAD